MLFATSTVPTWSLILLAIAPFAPWLGIGVTAWLGLKDLRLKARAERVEADVKLLDSFARLADIADARAGLFLSETAAKKIVEGWDGPPKPIDLRPAVAQGPVSAIRQAAALIAIAELMGEHEVLREPGKTTLRGLNYLLNSENEDVRDAYETACSRVRNQRSRSSRRRLFGHRGSSA